MPDLGINFHKFDLLVGGNLVYGFESVRMERSIEAAAAGFEMRISDPFFTEWPVPEGVECELRVDGDPIVAGFVDAVKVSFSESGHEVTIAGREGTADLIDCSPLLDPPAEFHALTIDAIAAKLAQPFGVKVILEADPGEPFFRFAIQPSETAYEALERAARLRGLLITSDGLGKLVITQPGIARAVTALVYGKNVKSGGSSFDRSQRFHRYVVKGQQSGSDDEFGDDLSVKGEAFDDSIRTTRQILVLAEGQVAIATAQKRAEWEAAYRAARGSQVTLVVQGWRQGPDKSFPFWKPNLRTHVQVPFLRVDNDLLISSVRMSRDLDGGTLTELNLCRSDAFQPQPTLTVESDLGMADASGDEQD